LYWAALTAVALTLLNLPTAAARRVRGAVREALAPLHGLLSGAALRVREAASHLRGLGGMVGENRRMAEELALLRRRVHELSALDAENEALRAQLGFRRAERRPLIPAEVIARDPTGWWQTVRLDRGARDGLRPGLAVIAAEGLVGRTVEVSARTADVLLISDPNSRVSARLPRTDAVGVLIGSGVRPSGRVVCRLDFVHRHLPVKPGDEVVTSGLGGVFPSGLVIGYVEAVFTDEQGLYHYAEVIPRADLGQLRYTFVLPADEAGADTEDAAP